LPTAPAPLTELRQADRTPSPFWPRKAAFENRASPLGLLRPDSNWPGPVPGPGQ